MKRISLVDSIVLSVSSTFRDMDFPTRNLYRSAIEELSRGADRTELDVTRAAVEEQQGEQHARRSAMSEADRRADTGYYLLAGGRSAFEVDHRLPVAAQCVART